MKQTITRLAAAVIDLAGEIGTEAEDLDNGNGNFAARCIVALARAQHDLNQAQQALRLAIGAKSGGKADKLDVAG